MDRRDFLKSAALTSAAALAPAATPALVQFPAKPKTFVGIQMDIGRILTDGVTACSTTSSASPTSTLSFYTITYMQERVHHATAAPFRGGNFATVHPQYYHDTVLKPEDTRSPDFPSLDILAAVVPAARKRGIQTFCWIIEDNTIPKVPNMDKLWEVDLYGRPTTKHPGGACFNNPNYTNYLLGLVEDYTRSYQVDGIMFGSERQGPLGYALGAYHNGAHADPGTVCCFSPSAGEGPHSRYQLRARPPGLPRARKVRSRRPRQPPPHRRLLRCLLASPARLPRDPRLGALLDQRPAGYLRVPCTPG